MIWTSLLLLLIGLATVRTSTVVHLENCTYAVDLYREYLNLLWSSDDARTLHIQAIYSLPSNQTFLPGHITSYGSPSVALIPFFVRCTSPTMFISTSYLPFGQCASTRTNILAKKNYESTRTNLNLKSILSLDDVPLLYLTESSLSLSDCSFQSGSTVYQLKATEIFSFRIEYESAALSTHCHSCNQRTAMCDEQTCQCRPGAIPLKLHQDQYYCVDVTQDCSLDPQRCLHAKSLVRRRSDPFLFLVLLSILLGCLFCLLLVLLWCLVHYRKPSEKECESNQSIYTVEKHERTPSTISTTDSLKGHAHWPCPLTNEYVSQFYEEYPRIIGEENNGEIVLILA